MLEHEYRTYERHKKRLLREAPGQYALIVADDVCGTFPTHDAAYVAGVERFGRRDMLIQHLETDRSEPAVASPALFVGLTDAPAPRNSPD